MVLVSRDDLSLKELVRRHRGKQGQENAFKGPLRDMDLHHPPCRGYRANQAFYALGQIAQVLLRAVQYEALPKSARRHGIRHVMRATAHMVRTARRRRARPRARSGRSREPPSHFRERSRALFTPAWPPKPPLRRQKTITDRKRLPEYLYQGIGVNGPRYSAS